MKRCNIALLNCPEMKYYESLLSFLNQNKYLVFPGLGTIEYKAESSKIIQQGASISAPRIQLYFREHDTSRLASQIQYFSKNWSLDILETQHAFQNISSNIIQGLSKHGQVELPSIGSFELENESIYFISSKELSQSFNYLSRDIILFKKFKSKSNKVPKTEDSQNIAPIILRPKYYKDIAAILLTVIISLVGINLIPEIQPLVRPIHFEIDSSEYDFKDFNRAPETDGTEKNIDIVLDETYDTTQLYEKSQENAKVLDTIQETDEKLNKITTEQFSTNQETCIFITGSFNTARNVQRMITELKSKGLTVYRAPYNGLTRVGVEVPCDDRETLQLLDEIEQNYWLLENDR